MNQCWIWIKSNQEISCDNRIHIESLNSDKSLCCFVFLNPALVFRCVLVLCTCSWWKQSDDLVFQSQLPFTILWPRHSVFPLHSWATLKVTRWGEEPSRWHLYTSSLTERLLSGSRDASRGASTCQASKTSTVIPVFVVIVVIIGLVKVALLYHHLVIIHTQQLSQKVWVWLHQALMGTECGFKACRSCFRRRLFKI